MSLERAESVQLFNVLRQVVPQYGRMSAETTFTISCKSIVQVQREVTSALILNYALVDVSAQCHSCMPVPIR